MLDVSKCQRGSSVLLCRNVCVLWLQANIDDDARVVEMSSSLDQILMYLSIFQRQCQRIWSDASALEGLRYCR